MLQNLIEEARACRLCAAHLPLGPRPVFLVGPEARLLIVGQAPGRRVHETGIPWNDPSGENLREWLALDRARFYDTRHVAILPTGLCFPGSGVRGDLPPRAECAPRWHPRFRDEMPGIRLTLLIGMHAQAYYLGRRRKRTLARTVRDHEEYLPEYFPLPHPSPRNRLWMKRHPWFAQDVLPALRRRLRAL